MLTGAGHVNNNSTPFTSAQLSTIEWKNIYISTINEKVEKLNSPKYEKIKPLFNNYLNLADIGSCWSKGTTIIDDFVSLRGEVAHRGREGKYIQFKLLTKHEALIKNYATETDNSLSDHLRTLVTPCIRPWNRLL